MPGDTATLRDALLVLRRRKWLIALAIIAMPLAAVAVSSARAARYEAEAQVLLSRQTLAQSLTGTLDQTFQDPARVAETQAELARVPEVAARALAAAGRQGSPAEDLLSASAVEAQRNRDLLRFTVRDESSGFATRLATAYAREFVAYRNRLDTLSIENARRAAEAQLGRLKEEGERHGSPLLDSLRAKIRQLRTLQTLQTPSAILVRPAGAAAKTRPRPFRDGVAGLALGAILGLGLAFLREALDRRVSSEREITERLALPLLGRVPRPSRRRPHHASIITLEEPASAAASAFRMVRTAFELANRDLQAKSVLVTSAIEGEGKSNTVANLAVALARAGKTVALVDLDSRRPGIARLFGLEGRPGLIDAALNRATLDEVLVPVTAPDDAIPTRRGGASPARWAPDQVESILASGWQDPGPGQLGEGSLYVLPWGAPQPYAGEFAESPYVAEILETLGELAELVLIDAPPLLNDGDAGSLSAKVDAVLLVLQLGLLREATLVELSRVLESSPAKKLGFILTGTSPSDGYGVARMSAPPQRKTPVGGPR